MRSTLSGITSSVNPQDANAESPMYVSVFGKAIFLILSQHQNAFFPIVTTPSGIFTSERLLHCEKVSSPMEVTPLAISISVTGLNRNIPPSPIFFSISDFIVHSSAICFESLYDGMDANVRDAAIYASGVLADFSSPLARL